jgi:hypothetical protein
VPPQIIASASPRWMTRKASPMACAPVEQADTCERFGPLAPKRIEICPGARLTMIIGTKKGRDAVPRALLAERPARRLDRRDAAQAAPTKQPTRSAFGGLDLEARVLHRERGGPDGVLDEGVDVLRPRAR